MADSKAAGVSRIICVGTTTKDSKLAIAFANEHEQVWATVGTHPHEASEFLKDKQIVAEAIDLLKEDKVVAVGEIGLDFYKNYTPKLDQEKALRGQIEAGLPSNLPFIFHVRDAWSDFWRIVDEYSNLRGIVHSFSSGTKQLDETLSRGFLIGLNGIMTFTKDQAQLEAAKNVPLDKLLLETDAPFLAPAAVRGQICEPKHLVHTAEFLARLRQETVVELAQATTENAMELFGI